MLVLVILIVTVFVTVLTSFVCFLMAFHVRKTDKILKEEYPLPPGSIYKPYHEQMKNWMREVRALPFKECAITSFDGLTLYGRYYECKKDAPMEIMFHGYRGNAERDLCGGVQRAFALGRNVLLVDQRAAGKSGGHVITFGINESRDCIDWVNYSVKEFGSDVKIILTGISMGAATVCIASGEDLPENVIGILADCGFSSAKAIIKKVICDMKLPADIIYPFVRLGARLFGRFDLEEKSALDAVSKTKLPVIFFHGDDDRYVPCCMSIENYNACNARKRMVTVKGAGHGMAYLSDPENYLKEAGDFFR